MERPRNVNGQKGHLQAVPPVARVTQEASPPSPARVPVPVIGSSLVMRQLMDRVTALSVCDAPVLITGEPGTGKKLIARELHARSGRAAGPFVVIGPAAQRAIHRDGHDVNEPLARSLCASWRRQARGGTLVLDAIDELSPRGQMLLARILREGPDAPERPRVVSLASLGSGPNVTPHALHVHVPALRDREEDIHPLVTHFLRELVHGLGIHPTLSPRAWRLLMFHAFPNNVRELAWAVEQALLRAKGGDIDAEHLPPELVRAQMSGVRRVAATA